jgi:hypothetical protein
MMDYASGENTGLAAEAFSRSGGTLTKEDPLSSGANKDSARLPIIKPKIIVKRTTQS